MISRKCSTIAKTCIGTALELLEPTNTSAWKPRMQMSLENTEKGCAAENRQYEIEFKDKYDAYYDSKSVQTYENNHNTKAYALPSWERCNKAMKNKIEARSDYTIIKNNPITLLIAIKKHALNYQEN